MVTFYCETNVVIFVHNTPVEGILHYVGGNKFSVSAFSVFGISQIIFLKTYLSSKGIII